MRECLVGQDRRLASHVLNVHKEGRAPATENGQELLSPELLRAYIATAKTYQPHCPRELTGAADASFLAKGMLLYMQPLSTSPLIRSI